MDHPKRVLIVHKFYDDAVFPSVSELAKFLLEHWKTCVLFVDSTFPELGRCNVYDSALHDYLVCTSPDQYSTLKLPRNKFPDPPVLPIDKVVESRSCLSIFKPSMADKVDLIVCMGGDGTLLQVSSMFQNVVPPVIGFAMGTHCFLNPFLFDSYRTNMKWVMDGSPTCLLRSRIHCRVVRGACNEAEKTKLPHTAEAVFGLTVTPSTSAESEYHCLNELVIDRGVSASVCDLTIKVNGRTVTSIEGDGLVQLMDFALQALALSLVKMRKVKLSRGSTVPTTMPVNIISCRVVVKCRMAIPTGTFVYVHSTMLGDEFTEIIKTHGESTDWFCRLTRLVKWNVRRGVIATVDM